MVVLPASGCEMIANVRRFAISDFKSDKRKNLRSAIVRIKKAPDNMQAHTLYILSQVEIENNLPFAEKEQKSGASIGRNSTRHTVKREIYESTEWENCAVAGYKPHRFWDGSCVVSAPLSLTIVYHKKTGKQWTGYIKYGK